ncbi:hypothetical protein F3W80_25165 [Vibrio parahaemolyticus]|nr:hypothetical protein [Vibrio parahaemolyticus]
MNASGKKKHNKAFKSDSQRLAVSLRSSIAKRRSHLNAALGAAKKFLVLISFYPFGNSSLVDSANPHCRPKFLNHSTRELFQGSRVASFRFWVCC